MEKKWDIRHSPPVELCGKTIGIVGYGRIGRALARRAETFGMRIIAVKRNPEEPGQPGFRWDEPGDPEGKLPDRLLGSESLPALLEEADFVVNCLPHTPYTQGLFGEKEFKAMKSGAYFINVGRGETVDYEAMVRALQMKHIAGAGLDAFGTEPDPIPDDSPLWALDNVFLSPHISGTRHNDQYLERTTPLFCENLRRYISNEPLINVVTKKRGY